MRKNTIHDYLTRYAEQPTRPLPKGHWQTCVVVPLYNEGFTPVELLESLRRAVGKLGNPAIAILVFNSKQSNPAAHEPLKEKIDSTDWGLLTIWSEEFVFPDAQGVGLARKIGCDLALRLYANGQLEDPYLRTTDADATVSENYFSTLDEEEKPNYYFNYVHRTLDSDDGATQTAGKFYDSYLRYYMAGLEYAKSPYAFPTIGSTLAIHVQRYAEVRGFPKRIAAEDFYLLNKLAKISPVLEAPDICVQLQARTSDRVPFGTGRSIRDWSEKIRNQVPILWENPNTFRMLRKWLRAQNAFAQHGDFSLFETQLNGTQGDLLKLFDKRSVQEAFNTAYKSSIHLERRLNHLNGWFDALKTRQLLSRLSAVYPQVEAPIELTNFFTPQECLN